MILAARYRITMETLMNPSWSWYGVAPGYPSGAPPPDFALGPAPSL